MSETVAEFDYAPVRHLIISGDAPKDVAEVLWSLMDHAKNLESKLAAATRPAPPPVKRTSRGSGVGARNAVKTDLPESFTATLDDTENAPFSA